MEVSEWHHTKYGDSDSCFNLQYISLSDTMIIFQTTWTTKISFFTWKLQIINNNTKKATNNKLIKRALSVNQTVSYTQRKNTISV